MDKYIFVEAMYFVPHPTSNFILTPNLKKIFM